jgi:hypothetical protein
MIRFLTTLAVLTIALPSIATAEWFTVYGTGKPAKIIRGEHRGKPFSVGVYKVDLQATELVLRRDTERADYYWVEATLTRQRDSGDGYMLLLDGIETGTIYTRGPKWAVGFDSINDARRCFAHLRKLHRLDTGHARDATKD